MKSRNIVLAIFVCLVVLPGAADAATYTVTNTNDAGTGSLRWAINQANMTLGADTIEFNIPVSPGDAITIYPNLEYVITDTGTTIDGFSQPGSSPNTNPAPEGLNTQLMISIDGFNIGNNGLAVFAIETDQTTIKGLNVNSGPLYEISIGRNTLGCSENRVQGCFLGTNRNGTVALPSGWLPWNPPMVIGVYVAQRAAYNYIGSDGDGLDDAAERNLISGEAREDMNLSGHGVFLDGSRGMVSNTVIAGNLIGTTPDPDVPLGNNYGVSLFAGVSTNTIAGNVIAGNNADGIWAGSWAGSVASVNQDNRIHGNYIGINPGTDNPVPNRGDGIHLGPGNQDFTVGTTGWTQANVISGNAGHGVFLRGGVGNDSTGNTFVFNIVGLDISGAGAVPNGGDGFHLELNQAANFIGDTTDGNLISANLGHGIYLMDADHVIIQNNVLGLNMTQDVSRPNGNDGVGIHCSDLACCDSTAIWQNRIHGNAGHGIGLYGRHTSSDIGPNTIDHNDGAGIYSRLPGDTNFYWGHNIEHNGGHGIELAGSSAQIDGNTINDNTLWGIANYPFFGGDFSPAGAANDVVGTPTMSSNDINANQGGGIISMDCEPLNGTSLHTDNTIGDNNSRPDVEQRWFGAVEIIDSSSPPPIISGGYTVTLTDLEMATVSGTVHDGGLWGPTGFDSADVSTWFPLVQYRVDNAGSFHTHTPHNVVVTGPTGGTKVHTFDGIDNDIDTCNTLGCSPAGILTGGQFRYQVVEVMTQTDSDGDGVADSADCAPFDAGYQGTAGGVPCDADSDGYCNDAITGGVKPSACINETACTPGLCTPTDCLDSDPAVNPGAAEGPPGDATCGDALDNDCDGLTDLNDPNCPHCISDEDCDDGNICTTNTCDPATGCQTSFNTLPCDDGMYCNEGETCQSGTCQGGSARDCSSFDDPCNLGACDEVNDTCYADPAPKEGLACNDGLYCNVGETCQAGACTGGTARDCTAFDDQCNLGACDESGDTCYADPAPKNGYDCDDSDPCTMNDTCSGGSCTGAPLDADSDTYVSDDCGGDDCDDSNGAVHPNAPEDCDDGVDNDCDGLTDNDDPGCAVCSTNADCDDANVCNGEETCVGGFCQPGTPLDCNDDNVCTTESCDPSAGCQHANNTLPCDDGDACTMEDTCAGGTCAGVPLDADHDTYVSDACGGDDCDDSDASVHPNAAEDCDDGVDNDCDGDTDLDDSNCAACTTDEDCDDANVCNGTETCAGGFCLPGSPPDCDDADPCTDDSCDPVLGCVHTNNTDPCDDSDPCTVNDVCENGTCSGEPLDADSDGYAPEDCGGGDCDDSDAAVNPDADEICDDSVDNDCDGDIDADDSDCQGCPDLDGDGFASDACVDQPGQDCDDSDAAVNPDALEICTDGIDNDCDGDTDLDDDECKRPAGSCGCGTGHSTAPAFLMGLLGLLLLKRRRRRGDFC